MKKILTSLLLVALFFTFSGEVSAQTASSTVVANAGIDQTILLKGWTGTRLSGYFSTSPNGVGDLRYSWTQVSGPTVDISGGSKTTINPWLSLPQVGTYEFKLTVSSIANPALSSSDNVVVKVFSTPPAFNSAPTVYIGPNLNVSSSTFPTGVSFYADANDQNGTQLTYKWTQVSGPTVSLSSGGYERQYTAIFPKAGLYVFKVLVSDGVNTNVDGVYPNNSHTDNYIAVSVHDTRQTITVTYPNGGEVLKAGSLVSVQFNSSVVDRYHKLELMPELGTGNIVAGGLFKKVTTSGLNSFGFTLPASSTPGRYSAKVTAYDSDYQWGVSNDLTSDRSNSSFKIEGSTAVATTVPVVTFVSSSVNKTIIDGGSDVGEFEIKLKIGARGGDMYVSSNFVPMIYTSANRQVLQSKYTHVVKPFSGSGKTASGNYLIKDGNDEVFYVTVIGRASDMGGTDSYRANLVGFAYSTRDVSTDRSFHSLNHTVFKTNFITLFNTVTPPPVSSLEVWGPWVFAKQTDRVTVGDVAQFTSTKGDPSYSYSCGADGKLVINPLNSNGIAQGTFYCQYSSAGKKDVKILLNGFPLVSKQIEVFAPDATNSSISVLYPTEGKLISLGSKVKVEWTTKNIPTTETFLIRLRSVSTGQEYNLVSGVLNDQSESVVISPTLPEGYYKLEMKSSKSVIGTSGAFKVSTPVTTTAPTATGIQAALVSTDTDTAGGEFKITYKIKAVGTDVYVPSSPVAVSSILERNGVAVNSSSIVSLLTTDRPRELTPNGNYVIRNGEEFVFVYIVRAPTVTTGNYRLSINGLRWRNTDSTGSPNTHTSGLESFRTNYVTFSQGDRASQIASIQATLDILIQALRDLKD